MTGVAPSDYTFVCAGGSELRSAFLSTGSGSLSGPSGVKQQRISLPRWFGSEVLHLWHSCADKCIPKRGIQRRAKPTARWDVSPSHWQLLPVTFLLFISFTALPKSVLQSSPATTLLGDTNSLNTCLPQIPFLAVLFRLAFNPTLSTTPESEHDGSW